ncbi:hypothetical protein AZF37_08740 [endosymbiont 'TC1' of Trimyema compressum]|nr:hypothetical protein AZF37_08740 [endosymbiont 'TC1' of Trimyema compressum]
MLFFSKSPFNICAGILLIFLPTENKIARQQVKTITSTAIKLPEVMEWLHDWRLNTLLRIGINTGGIMK